MTFSVEDYQKAIARIVGRQGAVIGTGFLVAPGYVLTCAHVVLQAIGIAKDKFVEHQEKPQEPISLDFPILADGQRIDAEVIEWLPYSIESGDVAVLKLLTSEPEGVRAIPLVVVSATEIEKDEHIVYGFGNNQGGRSDAYRPKTTVAGARFQLCKFGDPNDETIQAGFSGAPVWNQVRHCVIGMVATAVVLNEQKSKAYAITAEKLSPVIQKLFARSLYDSIHSHLESARQQVQYAVEAAFWLCDTDGNRAKSDDLLDRLLFLLDLPNRGWEQDGRDIDRLTQLAMFLVVMDGVPRALVNEISTWVKCRNFDFDALYVRANQYRQERQVSSTTASPHLIVQIKPGEQDVNKVCVSIWVVDDRDRYAPLEPRPARLQDHVIAFTDLPSFLETWLQEESEFDSPMIHCFVARHLLGCDLDACETESGLTLGNQYKLVMRTDLSQSSPGKQYYARWKNKWQSFEGKQHAIAREAFVRSDCSDRKQLYKQLYSAEMAILENLPCSRIEEVFKFIADKVALPIALWVRQDELCKELDRILDCTIIELPERIFEERLAAVTETCLGSHLSLVWEDPKVVPPTMIMPLTQ